MQKSEVMEHLPKNKKKKKIIPKPILRTGQNICYYHEGSLDRAILLEIIEVKVMLGPT